MSKEGNKMKSGKLQVFAALVAGLSLCGHGADITEDLRQTLIASWGYLPAQLLYVTALTAAHILFIWGVYALSRLLARLADRVFGGNKT